MNTVSGRDLTFLGNRTNFNRTLRHIVQTSLSIDGIESGNNLADILNDKVAKGELDRKQIPPVLSVILVNRLQAPTHSKNLEETISSDKFPKLIATFSKWNAVQFVIAYHHPNLGVLLVNPAREDHWEAVMELKRDELIVVYARALNGNKATSEKALDSFFQVLSGKDVTADPDFMRPELKSPEVRAQAAPAPTPAPSAAPSAAPAAAPTPVKADLSKKNLTPKYSVQVTNELFHNGNVEAWKNIIESYVTANPGNQVIVYHEGELIQDLNALFKWGKVKHGGVIFFQVAGTNIKGVSKLQKYLFEGASNRFESFLKHDVNRVLSLF